MRSETLTFLVLAYLFWGCSYRFTNLHQRAPLNAKTIFVESIYDISKNPVPHEYLWTEIQNKIAINGILKLSSPKTADLYLRAELAKVETTPHTIEKAKDKDPDSFYEEKSGFTTPYPMGAYPNMGKASSFVKSDFLNVAVNIEVFDLKGKRRIFQKTYRGSAVYSSFTGNIAMEYGFLTADENAERAFAKIAEAIAKNIVVDLLQR